MNELKLKLDDFAKDIVGQLKELVPVRTGRLKNGISYKIEEKEGSYWIYLRMEDYFKYLKPRTREQKLPTQRELEFAYPPLPKMDDLGKVKMDSLSPRAKGIMNRLNIEEAVQKIDMSDLEEQIRKVIFQDYT